MAGKILVVDDVYTTRLKTELVLRHAGRYTVQSVSSGPEAVTVARATPPDAIVMDIVMAGMDGFATLRELRNHGIQCKVIAYTARRERKSGEFETRGFDAYIPKSESLDSLLAMLQLIVNQTTRPDRGHTHASFSEPINHRLPFRQERDAALLSQN